MIYASDSNRKDIESKFWNIIDDFRGRPGFGDPSALPPALYCAWLLAENGSSNDLEGLLEAAGLPEWSRDAIMREVGDSLPAIRSLAASYPSDKLRELAIASFDFTAVNFGRSGGDFITPDCIVSLALKVLAPGDGDSIADFGCGWGSFLAASSACAASLYGVDPNRRAAAFATIRMSLLGVDCDIERDDMLRCPGGLSFDRCFSQLPFGLRLSFLNLKGTPYEPALSGDWPLGRPASADWVFAKRILDATAEDGRAAIVMSNGATFNHGDASARRHFAESGRLEAVVALPARLFSHTVSASTMVVFGDGSKGVRMVDATDLTVPGRRYDSMGPDEIAEVMRRLSEDGPMSKIVGADDLAARNWSVAPQRYLRREIELENATPLGDLTVAIERGAAIRAAELDELATPEDTGISYLPASSVADGRTGGDLPHITGLDPKHQRACLKDGDLVLTKIGSPVRVAVAEVPEGQTVVATGNLYVVRLDTERIDPYFLAAFLSSDDGQELACGLATGTTIPTIALRDLRGLEVPVPPMDVQRRVAERYQAALDEIEVHKVRLERARSAATSAYDEEMGR